MEERYHRTRLLNNEASKRFRMKRRAEAETLRVSSVVLNKVNRTMKARENTLLAMRKVLRKACSDINQNDNSCEEELDCLKLPERLNQIARKDPRMDIPNQRLVNESKVIRNTPGLDLLELESQRLETFFRRPLKKGPGVVSRLEDEEFLDLLQHIRDSSEDKKKVQEEEATAPTSRPVSVIVRRPVSKPVTEVPLLSERTCSNSTSFVPILPKPIPQPRVTSRKEDAIKKMVSSSVEVIPIDKNYQRRKPFPQQIKPDLTLSVQRLGLPPGTAIKRVRVPSAKPKHVPIILKSRMTEKNLLKDVTMKTGVEIFPISKNQKMKPRFPPSKPHVTITRVKPEVKPEPCSLDSLFPISGNTDPPLDKPDLPLLEVSRQSSILWNINVTHPVPSDPEAGSNIKIKQELEDIIGA